MVIFIGVATESTAADSSATFCVLSGLVSCAHPGRVVAKAKTKSVVISEYFNFVSVL